MRVMLGGKEHSPIDISATIPRKLKEDAKFRRGEDVTRAVITVPAYFSQIQRAATRKAGLKAGLRVMKILDEPTAAALAILPLGLPQDTQVRVRLWLNSDAVFELTAHLENGADLHPWIVKGEADAKAIEVIQCVEQVLAQKSHPIALFS